jgi:hypothetical protein
MKQSVRGMTDVRKAYKDGEITVEQYYDKCKEAIEGLNEFSEENNLDSLLFPTSLEEFASNWEHYADIVEKEYIERLKIGLSEL